MNKYSDDFNSILDATGKPWPVETPHLLPLPEGIECGIDSSDFASVVIGPWRDGGWAISKQPDGATHWLARRPLPPVPKVKTQEEKDEEAFDRFWAITLCMGVKEGQQTAWREAIAYARGGAK